MAAAPLMCFTTIGMLDEAAGAGVGPAGWAFQAGVFSFIAEYILGDRRAPPGGAGFPADQDRAGIRTDSRGLHEEEVRRGQCAVPGGWNKTGATIIGIFGQARWSWKGPGWRGSCRLQDKKPAGEFFPTIRMAPRGAATHRTLGETVRGGAACGNELGPARSRDSPSAVVWFTVYRQHSKRRPALPIPVTLVSCMPRFERGERSRGLVIVEGQCSAGGRRSCFLRSVPGRNLNNTV